MNGASHSGDALEIAPGLVRWTAPHPDWDPDAAAGSSADWGQSVGSVLYEQPEVVTLIDPLLPPDGRGEFLRWLDGRVAGRPVSILTTNHWHRRDRAELGPGTRYRRASSHSRCGAPARRCSGCPRSRRSWPATG
ncbi:MAG: hypothetical protein E6G62_06500 [Actinobacteria bacterium]|nr:MAG: hypothetical protein E6G62_06500 [Actinomycetota bacterium]